MNGEKTIDLWRQGRDAWNAWAWRMLAERKVLEERGEWSAQEGRWEQEAEADFRGFVCEDVIFNGFIWDLSL